MGKNTKYNFPSGAKVEFNLNEIERPLRRKFRSETSETLAPVFFILLAVAIATASLIFLGKFLEYQERQQEQVSTAIDANWSGFCAQALKDHAATGTAARESLKELCTNNE